MKSLYELIQVVLNLYWWVLIIYVVMSWLISFKVVNTYSPFINTLNSILHRLTDPLLRPIRRIVPSVGGLDLSVLVLMLLVWFAQRLLWEYWGSQL
ncbi:MAG: YggT family protein [Alphaproteobacteria bacterium]